MIKESEWFCAIEGIAIAERIYNIYEGVSKVKPARPEGTEVHSPGQATPWAMEVIGLSARVICLLTLLHGEMNIYELLANEKDCA